METDRGYRHPRCQNPEDFFTENENRAKKRVAKRHECINNRIKQWRSLTHMFRHSHHEHKFFFFTAAIVDNLGYQKFGPIFDASY